MSECVCTCVYVCACCKHLVLSSLLNPEGAEQVVPMKPHKRDKTDTDASSSDQSGKTHTHTHRWRKTREEEKDTGGEL